MVKSKPRKEQILEVAAHLFRKKGFNGTTVRMIAGELGIEAASLYNHISSKQEILCELLLHMAGLFTEGMHKIESSDANPYQKLENLVSLHVRLTLRFPNELSLITGEWVHLKDVDLQQYNSLRNDYEQRFKSIIKQGITEGFLESAHVELTLFSILSTLHWLYSWVGKHPDLKEQEIEQEMKQALLLGLKKR